MNPPHVRPVRHRTATNKLCLAQAEVAQFVDEVPPELIQDEDLNVGTSTLKGVSKSGVGNGKVVVGEGPAGGVNSPHLSRCCCLCRCCKFSGRRAMRLTVCIGFSRASTRLFRSLCQHTPGLMPTLR